MKKRKNSIGKVQKGRYIIDVTIGQLYFRDNSMQLAKIGGLSWTRARCIAADKHWLYITDNGYLYKVHPQTGDYLEIGNYKARIQRPIWFDRKWLYTLLRTNSAVDNNDLFAEVWRLKPDKPEYTECVAKRVRLDMPSIADSLDKEIYLDIS